MDLDAALAAGLLQDHPDEAARLIEGLPLPEAAAVLSQARAETAGRVLRRISVHVLDALLPSLAPGTLAAMLRELDVDTIARILRRLAEEQRDDVLDGFDAPLADPVRTLLRHAEETAGALLDPHVLAFPAELSVEEAIAQVRAHPEHARYNLYVTDGEQILVGVMNLRELLLAPRDARLASVMKPASHRLPAHADRYQIAGHPGWRDVHAIPVVDEHGAYLGAIRYRTLRRIERELAGVDGSGSTAARALAELYATAATSLVEALTGGRGRRRE